VIEAGKRVDMRADLKAMPAPSASLS
jgi:hypothetical protein